LYLKDKKEAALAFEMLAPLSPWQRIGFQHSSGR